MKPQSTIFVCAFLVLFVGTTRGQMRFFSTGGDPTDVHNWKSNRGGTGKSPLDFTTKNQILVVQGTGGASGAPHNLTVKRPWLISKAVKVQIENGATVVVDTTIKFASMPEFEIAAGGALRYSGGGSGDDSGLPSVVRMIGPVSQNQDLRNLPYIPPTESEEEERRLTRHPPQEGQIPGISDPFLPERNSPTITNMPDTLLTFAGFTSTLSGCGCLPPDVNGDIGPNHYIQSVNSSIRIHNKTGTVLSGPTTYNSFFSALGASTPCGNNNNQGDGVVFYDHIADRWVVSDFAFAAFPGTSFCQCVGVSKTNDPVSGGWWLYSVQIDPSNPSYLGDYPKFGLWPDAYYFSLNLFSNNTTFNGVRVIALDRNSMISGGAANAIGFNITPANLGDQYSLLPGTFRTGSSPPAGQPEWVMNINASVSGGAVENQVFVRRFHVDFATPANSTFGAGATHAADGTITVNNFVEAFTTVTKIMPNGTSTTSGYLDGLADKLMYPLIYQNLLGAESIWAVHTVNNNQNSTGPAAIRWYQFNVTGNSIPATAVQQQTFNNGADGLWRWMPSANVDAQGNFAIGYSTSSTTVNPGIRYAGRLKTDPLNILAQGEAILFASAGHQTSTSGRWGDYSATYVDPSDGLTFYHTNEYYSTTSSAGWNTRVGAFKFPAPVPITLAYLNVQPVSNGRGVEVNWGTISEINNYGFWIQKSPADELHYADIEGSFTPGHGTTNEPQRYTFTDNTVGPNSWYYRLKQVDLDGSAHYSDAVRIEILTSVADAAPRVFALLQNYPNPFNPSTNIEYSIPFAGHVNMKVYDVVGREVATLVNEEKEAGDFKVTFDAKNLPSGVYFYRLTTKNAIQTKKIVLMK